MERTRRGYLATTGTAVGALAAGCLGERGPADADSGATNADLVLNWQPSGLHVPYFVARERGYYADEGIEVGEIERGQGSDFSATQVALENVEFGVTSGDQVLNVAAEGLSPVAVAVIMQRGPVVVFTERDGFGEELTEPAQLEGATVGSGPGMVRTMTDAYVEHHGLTGDVEIVDAGQDTVQQLLTGEVDAAAGVFSDVVDARHQDATIDELRVADDVPSYGHVIATSRGFLDEEPDTVEAFLRATARGAAWAATDVEGATDHLVDAVPELEEARENQRDKWDLLREEYLVSEAVEENGWGWNDGDVWENTAEVLADHDFFEDEPDPDAVWTNEFLDTDDEYVGNFTDQLDE